MVSRLDSIALSSQYIDKCYDDNAVYPITSAHSLNSLWLGLGLVNHGSPTPYTIDNDSRQLEWFTPDHVL